MDAQVTLKYLSRFCMESWLGTKECTVSGQQEICQPLWRRVGGSWIMEVMVDVEGNGRNQGRICSPNSQYWWWVGCAIWGKKYIKNEKKKNETQVVLIDPLSWLKCHLWGLERTEVRRLINEPKHCTVLCDVYEATTEDVN